MKEVWKDITGYEGYYKISNMGRVKSVGRYKNCCHGSKQFSPSTILKTGRTSTYSSVSFSVNKKRGHVRVHTLVAKHFIPNPNNLKEVNHINGIKSDNRVENLEWCTRSHNNKHMYKIGLAKPVKSWLGRYNAPDRSNPILQISKDGKLIKRWPSTAEVNRVLGFSKSNISFCVKGKYSHAYGYIWRREQPAI